MKELTEICGACKPKLGLVEWIQTHISLNMLYYNNNKVDPLLGKSQTLVL